MKRRCFAKERLARRSIGYFTENCGAASARCGGQVRGAPVKCFVSQQRKGERFLGVFRNAETRGRQDFDAGEGGSELAEDHRLVPATPGTDNFLNFCFV